MMKKIVAFIAFVVFSLAPVGRHSSGVAGAHKSHIKGCLSSAECATLAEAVYYEARGE